MKHTGQIVFISISILFSFTQIMFSGEQLRQELIDGSLGMIIAWFVGRQYDKMRFYAYQDQLTEAFNRRYAIKMFEKANRKDGSLSLFLVDVNNFKRVNDTLGHQAGDMVLKQLAQFLKVNTRKADRVVRWGGDEFLIIVPYLHRTEADTLIQRLENNLQKSLTTGLGYCPDIGLSIGYAVYPEDGTTLDELVRIADKNMYTVKKSS